MFLIIKKKQFKTVFRYYFIPLKIHDFMFTTNGYFG